MKLTQHFYKIEFESGDGEEMPNEVYQNIKKLAISLQILRDYINEPIFITSGYRSANHNKLVGGRPQSYHLKGMAADIVIKNKSPEQLVKIITELFNKNKMKRGGIGLYNGFVHYDIRGEIVKWNESELYKFE